MADPIQTHAGSDTGIDLIEKLNANFAARFSRDTATKTGDYTATANDEFLRLDATSNTVTLSLPAASSMTNRTLLVEAVNVTFAVTIDPSGAETINGAATKAIGTAGRLVLLYCDGTLWLAWYSDRLP